MCAWAGSSVRLVFVRADGPDGLQGELTRVHAGLPPPTVLPVQADPLALPERERRNQLPDDAERALGSLDVVVAHAGPPARTELVLGPHVEPVASVACAVTLLVEGVHLGAECPLAIARPRGRTPGEPEVGT